MEYVIVEINLHQTHHAKKWRENGVWLMKTVEWVVFAYTILSKIEFIDPLSIKILNSFL